MAPPIMMCRHLRPPTEPRKPSMGWNNVIARRELVPVVATDVAAAPAWPHGE